jgi:uncharacterized protein (TIGR00290 family)
MPQKTLLSWSSGKDCAWALHVLRRNPGIDVAGLFCTVNQAFSRVAMHGVRTELLEQQARCAGLPLRIIEIPYPCSDEIYAEVMSAFVASAKECGVAHFAFGDIMLQDVRRYREERLAGSGITPLFPLWGHSTQDLSRTMIAAGLKAIVTCLNPKHVPKELAGRQYDAALLDRLDAGVDPCGENGEFHTFAWSGPMFNAPVAFSVGETVERDGFVFTDLIAASA